MHWGAQHPEASGGALHGALRDGSCMHRMPTANHQRTNERSNPNNYLLTRGAGRVACFSGEAAPQAPASWVRPTRSCKASQQDLPPFPPPPGEPQK
jgi:hypothetical protein